MADSTEKSAKTPFFKGLKAEFKKIAWPDKDSIIKQSIAVVSITIVLAFVIACLDYIIQMGVNVLTSI